MQVDEPRQEYLSGCLDDIQVLVGPRGPAELRADGGNPAILHAEVTLERLGARTVVDFRVLDDQIEHVFFLPD